MKKIFYLMIIAYNTEYAKLSPGKVILGHGIQYAIENGFQVYDFVMGQDDYKFDLGAKRRADAVTSVITRKSLRSTIANVGLGLARPLRDLLRKR